MNSNHLRTALMGLNGAKSGDARSWLKKAIARHERHMDGSEPTSEASQMKMMDEMKAALAAMGGK